MTATGFVLATDLDGTFAAGPAGDRQALLRELAARDGAQLIYVTGRTPASARTLIEREALPVPAYLIADVGTTVLRGAGPDAVQSIEAEIAGRWPGETVVRARLSRLAELVPQAIDSPRRVSYWIEANRRLRENEAGESDFEVRAACDASLSAGAEAVAAVAARRAVRALAGVPVDVLVSGNVYLDILPRGVDKGSTLLRLLAELGLGVERCIVAGDSLNDRSLFEIGARGIVVGNCEPGLRAAVVGRTGVYVARADGVGGILEGMRHLNALPPLRGGHAHGE